MIGNSFLEYVTIRLSIGSLRLIAPVSCLYLLCCVIYPKWFNIPIALWATAEAVFYLFVYLPRYSRLQAPPTHPPPPLTRIQRRLIFDRCVVSAGSSGASYPTGWFFPNDSTPKKADVIDWLLWALFSSSREEITNLDEYQEELDEYISEIEGLLGEKLAEGKSTTRGLRSMRITLDPVLMLHRPLLWYLIVCAVDTYTCSVLLCLGFEHYAPREPQWRRAFPPRPILSFVTHTAPEGVVTPYWHLPHKSNAMHPVVFLHGIGIGLYPYIPFIRSLVSSSDAGILLPEILPICMHMTPRSVPPRTEMLSSMNIILESLRDKSTGLLQVSESSPLLDAGQESVEERTGWHRVVLASHSYGTFIAGWVVRECVDAQVTQQPSTSHFPPRENEALAQKIAHIVLVDPIPILLSHPAVAYNFLYRHPTAVCSRQLGSASAHPPTSNPYASTHQEHDETPAIEADIDLLPLSRMATRAKPSWYSSASAWQLWYFASRDADIARTLCRAFFWTEGGIWREEIIDFLSCADKDASADARAGGGSGTTGNVQRRRNMAVVLGGMDQIVPSEAIRKYLTREESWSELWTGMRLNDDILMLRAEDNEDNERARQGASGDSGLSRTRMECGGSKNGKLEVLFNPVLDHAVIFDDPRWTKALLDVVCRYAGDI